jgi:hypothetical protein
MNTLGPILITSPAKTLDAATRDALIRSASIDAQVPP